MNYFPKDYAEDGETPLTAEEIRKVRQIILTDDRWRWIAAIIRNFVLWALAVGTVVVSTKDWVIGMLGSHK